MLKLKINDKENRKYLLYDELGMISGVSDDATESVKEAYAELEELRKISTKKEIDY